MTKTRTITKLLVRIPVSGALFTAMMFLAAPALYSGPAKAQNAVEAPLLFLDVSTGLRYEDGLNRDGEFEATTSLDIGYFTSTANQRLSFESGVTARGTERRFDLIDPFAAITYARFNRDFEIGFDLSYSRTEVDGTIIEDDFDATDLEREDGTREDFGFGLKLVTGRTDPFGTDTELRYREVNYSDGATSDDTITQTARSTLRFTIDPRIQLNLTGAWGQEETDDLVDTVETTQRVILGAALAIDRAWNASVSLGYAEIETETTGSTTVTDGFEGSFILTRDLRNGPLVFSTDHVVTDDGWRNSLRVRRTIATANGNTFDASLGQIFFEEGGSGHLASLAYTRTARSGALVLGIDYSSDIDGAEFLIQRTRFDASLRQDLTDDSGWVLDGSIARVDYDNPASVDAMRVDLGLAYLHALSNDWNLAARVEHQLLYEDGEVDDQTNVLSLNLERRFSVRP